MSRFDESFEGRFKDEFKFDEWNLFYRIEGMIGLKVSNDFIWGFVDGIVNVSEYEFVYGKVLLGELRMYWKESRNV